MATRSSTRAAASASTSPAPSRRSLAIAQPASAASPPLLELRRQWKWAAVSQFVYTFAHLVALEDVSLVDIEEDLVNSTMIAVPRLMQRLLVTLSQDRRITVDNWQSALRRQYLKRDPATNPIGVEPVISRHSRAATVETDIKSEERDSVLADDAAVAGTGGHEASTDEHSLHDLAENGLVRKSEDVEASDPKESNSLNGRNGIIKEEEGEVDHDAQGSMRDWVDIPMLEKLESIHTVIEWHFQSPSRLRSIMRSDDDNASWRIEPIGYDAKRNAYWLIGQDRLWIQRLPPKPSRKAGKRKAISSPDTRKSKVARTERAKDDRQATKNMLSKTTDTSKLRATSSRATSQRSRRGTRQSPAANDILSSPPVANGRARAAKTQANVKLDLQAKQLAAAKAEMESFNRRSTARHSPTKAASQRALGVRMSRRLHGGGDDDDEWQQIPEEWLPRAEETKSKHPTSHINGSSPRMSTRNKHSRKEDVEAVHARSLALARKAGLESDSESDLTELSDSEVSTRNEDIKHASPPPDLNGVIDEHDETLDQQQTSGFIEWETLCVSLQEWEDMAHRFERATHYLEKALHKILTQEVVPFVTESLREIERQRQKEDALMHRKRSSRIAVKEIEKEASRLEAARRAEEDEKMARTRRLEARARREEDERLKRERAREQRRKEREERELARTLRLEFSNAKGEVDNLKAQSNGAANAKNKSSSGETSKESRSRRGKKVDQPSGESENWELDCEICGSKGINRDDGVPLMSCGKCNKWQHINCHDAVDRKAERPLRDWDTIDFFCKRCLASLHGQTNSPQGILSLHASRSVNGRDSRSNDRHSQKSTSPSLINGVGRSPMANTVSAVHQQVSGTTAFTGFAHYHPVQGGFSPHPSVLQHGRQLQAHSSTIPSSLSRPSLPHGDLRAWDSLAQGDSSASHGFDEAALSHDVQHGTGVGPSSYHQQSYTIALDSSVPRGSVQTIPYTHTTFPPSQHRVYNSASYHT